MSKYLFDFGLLQDFSHETALIDNLSDRFQHTYIIGKTGMGKSSLMERMALYDMKQGHAVIFIDPKGESVKKLYTLAPEPEKCLYISIEHPTVINPIDKPERRLEEVISEFVQIIDVLISLTASNVVTTVYMREILGYAIKAIELPENRNIEYVIEFLLYPSVRKNARITNPLIKKYWEAFDAKDNKYYINKEKQETAKRVAARLLEISDGRMRDFVVGRNELDISEIVQNGKVVLVDTSKMSLHARTYLSNLIVYSVLSYCEFSDISPQPLLVYVDEFQLVVSNWFSDLLARSRSRAVGFTLAHQSFQQIPRQILAVILDTVHALVAFRTGDEAATRLAPYFEVKSKELFNLPKYQAWVRLGTKNTLVQCFPPLKTNTDVPLPEPGKVQKYNFLENAWVRI